MREQLNQFAYDLLWTWQPRIEALFRTIDPELWRATRENPVLLLSQLGDDGVERAFEREDVQRAFADAQAAYRVAMKIAVFNYVKNPSDTAWRDKAEAAERASVEAEQAAKAAQPDAPH